MSWAFVFYRTPWRWGGRHLMAVRDAEGFAVRVFSFGFELTWRRIFLKEGVVPRG